jgi:hypothetical protein
MTADEFFQSKWKWNQMSRIGLRGSGWMWKNDLAAMKQLYFDFSFRFCLEISISRVTFWDSFW